MEIWPQSKNFILPVYNNTFAFKEIIISHVNKSISKNVFMIWKATRISINKAMFSY